MGAATSRASGANDPHRESPQIRGFSAPAALQRVACRGKIADPCGMAVSDIPDDVRRFVLGTMTSVPHLEALLLLHAQPGQCWSPVDLARRLYVDETSVANLLVDLRDAQLVRDTDEGWCFRPADAHLAATVGQLASVYSRQVVAITELIHSSSDRKAQRFADAFRLRKEP